MIKKKILYINFVKDDYGIYEEGYIPCLAMKTNLFPKLKIGNRMDYGLIIVAISSGYSIKMCKYKDEINLVIEIK